MKKILFVALAAFGLTACVQNEELAAPQGDAIAFDTFVDNATKAAQDGSYSNTNIFSSFQVWGTMENSAKLNIFAGVEVNNATGVWAYASQYTQYWIDGYTYDFAAVVDGVVEGGEYNMPATISTNLEEQKDVLYATASRAYSAGQAATPVELIFKHLLSKVKFTVKNTMTADSGFNYTVSNITIKDADKLGAYDVATATWAGSETYDVDFGMVTTDNATVAKLEAGDEAESNYERLLLPSDAKSLTVAVTYALNLGDNTVVSETKEVTALLDVEAGTAYNFVLTFGNPGDEVTFKPTIDEWITAPELTGDIVKDGDAYVIKTQTGFLHFANMVNNGNAEWKSAKVVLDTDIDLGGSEWTPIGNGANYFEGTFDGQGHKVSNFKVTALEGYAGLFGYARATIKNISVENVTLVATHYAGGVVGQGYVKLDNCHASNVNITLSTENHDNGDKAGGIVGQLLEGATLGISNSTVENVTIKGYRDLGGVTGMAHDNNFVKNCSATDVTIIQDLSDNYQSSTPTTLGAVVGRYGSNVVYEGCNGEATIYKYVINQETLNSALAANAKIILAAGEYTLTTFPAGATLKGEAEGVVINATTIITVNGAATIENAKVVMSQDGYKGFQGGVSLNFKNCTVEGQPFLYGNSAIFEGCTFVQTASGAYNVWTYAVAEAKFINCVFNCADRSVLIYNEGNSLVQNVTFEGCTLNAETPCEGKAAIEIGASFLTTGVYNATINNTTANGFGNGSVSGNSLWNVKNGNRVNVTVDGDVCFVVGVGAIEGGYLYDATTKTHMVASAAGLVTLSNTTIEGGQSVKLLANIDLTNVAFNGLSAFNPENPNAFDGQGYTVSNWTYTGRSDDMGFIRNWVGTIKNLTVKNAVLRTGGRSAVIAAKPYANIENCHVVDCNLSANYWACGLIAGQHNSGNMKNCTATNSYIYSTGGTAAITGVLNETAGLRTYEGCVATGCTINNPDADPFAGAAIIGLINIDNANVKLVNCAQSGNTFKGTAKNELVGYNAGDNTTLTIE